ncbi:hypothetical protein RJ640_002230 [Escallonia rubra]|uniref:Uncharacterized protein n=1 Tax=Escallonia rubra TaxID=112253 RepID=A0AA88RDE8_9ASTE|nr:hypothetical protein RJ640_002230 [Escallonia rubra]
MRRDLRTDGEAIMQVTLSNKLGVLVVEKFQDVYNYPLTTTPSKVVKNGSRSKYHRTNVCKSLVSDLNKEGLKPSQITRVVNVMKPSEEANSKSTKTTSLNTYCSQDQAAAATSTTPLPPLISFNQTNNRAELK